MPRTADELMNHHIESVINMKKDSNLEEALSDYSEELIAITRLAFSYTHLGKNHQTA